MPPQPLARRVEILEEKVDALGQLPARVTRVETELAALRTELRAEFAAVRVEIHDGEEETRRQMRILHEDVISRIALLQEGIDRSNGGNRSSKRKNKRRR